MALVVHDTLTLTTDNGESKIQLCIGDITKLPKQDEVDVLVVSAFPGKLLVNPVNPFKSVRKYKLCLYEDYGWRRGQIIAFVSINTDTELLDAGYRFQ